MRQIDVFNGDADGLVARHQFRLAYPATDAPTLVTGVKRDIHLAIRVDAGPDDQVSIFDISFDTNADAVLALLSRGIRVRYFDHHQADRLVKHELLDAHIDTSPEVCTSLLVDRHLDGRFRPWAIVAAFGDNLIHVAKGLAAQSRIADEQADRLRQLGECLNYNAYGDTEADLYFRPAELASRLVPYGDPWTFLNNEDVFERLAAGYATDLELAGACTPVHSTESVAVMIMPDEAWARRVSGAFANQLANRHPARAHAILTPDAHRTFTVSLRAPVQNPNGADRVATAFGGGGRAGAAGIMQFRHEHIDALIGALQARYAA